MSSWKLLLPPSSDVPRSISFADFDTRANYFNDLVGDLTVDLTKDSLMNPHSHIISEEWDISGSTSFESYGGGNTNHLARLAKEKTSGAVGQVASLISGDNVAATALIAGKTENLTISSELIYGYKCNAFFDVFVPAMIWKSLELPTMGKGGVLTPPGISLSTLLDTYGKGIAGDAQRIFDTKNSSKIPSLSGMSLLGGLLVWGPLDLRGMVLTKASPTFSKSVDENGYPTQVKIKIEFTTSTAATIQIIEGFLTRGVQRVTSVR